MSVSDTPRPEEGKAEDEAGGDKKCRLCHCQDSLCVSLYSDPAVVQLTSCLPVHIRASDPPSLPPWVCPVCIEKMRVCRQFFSQILTCYSHIVGGANLISFVKVGLLACLDKEEDIVKQELDDICEQKLEEAESSKDVDLVDGLDNSWNWMAEEDSAYIKDDESDVESDSDSKKRKRKSKAKPAVKGKRKKEKKEAETEDPGDGLLVIRKRKENYIKILYLPTMCSCSQCGLLSSSHLANQEHWRSAHPGDEVIYTCNEDEDDCKFSTPDVQSMKNHLREHLFKLGKIGQCEFCAKFVPKNHLSNHIKLVHELQKTFECKTCQKRFKTESILRTHELIHQPDDARYRFSCHVCGQRFTQRGNLDTHLKIHMGLKPYKCDSCEKAFTTSSGLKAHILVHTGERPFLCDSCDATFKSSSQLKTHVMEKHLNLHRYQCTYCPVKYNRLELLRNHEMSHTGETPYKCSTCGKGFRRKDKLRNHEFLHGPDDSKYRFPCEVCGKRFTQNNNLKTHFKSHHSSEARAVQSSSQQPHPPPLVPFSPPAIPWPAHKL